MKTVGEGLKLLNWFTKYFSMAEYKERAEDSLMGTSDALVYWLTTRRKVTDEQKEKKIAHYIKQYKATRKKIK